MRRSAIVLLLLFVLALALPAWSAEGRIPVWVDGTVIGSDGRYIVTRDIIGGGGSPVITIAASRVTLDLNGFTLANPGAFPVIDITANPDKVVIRNGNLVGGTASIDLPAAVGGGSTVVIEDIRSEAASGDAIHLDDLLVVEVRRVEIVDAGGTGIAVGGVANFKNGHIDHNSVHLTGGAGIHINHTAAMSVRHNRIEVPSGDGIFAEDSISCLVGENLISDADGNGIFLRSSRACKVYNNAVNRGETNGIFVDATSEDNFILDNVVRESGLAGAAAHGAGGGVGLLVSGIRNHIERNTVNWNDGCGMIVGGFNNMIGRNVATDNDPAAVFACGGACGPNPPDFCDTGGFPFNASWGDNFATGGAVF